MYEKKAAQTGPVVPATINFYYEMEKLFNSASIRSGYRGKALLNQAGESQTDNVQLSRDEYQIFKEYLEQGLFDVMGDLFKITQNISSPIFFDAEYVTNAPATLTCCGGKILDHAAYNENLLGNIDKKIENCLRYFVLTQWYVSINLLEDAKINGDLYTKYLREMKNLSFDLRKPLMS